MSEPGTPPIAGAATLEALIARLAAASERLRGVDLAPGEAAELVEQCAQCAAQASAELERLARAAASEQPVPPAQDPPG